MNEVVECARTWIGTPYHHQARIKGVGVDCAGLVIGVARELGIVSREFDVTGYHRAPDGWSFLGWADKYMSRVTRDEMTAGNCVVVRFGIHPQHIGIVGDYLHGGLSIIHALIGKGVIETRLLLDDQMKFVTAYAMPRR